MKIYAREDLTEPVVVDISAEEMLENHYIEMYDGIEKKVQGVKRSSQEERDKVFQELKMIRNELEKIIENLEDKKSKRKINRLLKLYKQLIRRNFSAEDVEDKKREEFQPPIPASPMMPPSTPPSLASGLPFLMASVLDPESDNIKFIDNETKKELMEYYGDKTCEAIQGRHPNSHYVISDDDIMIIGEDDSKLLRVGLNDKLHVNRIIPVGKISRIYPYQGVEFYQKYWKPIVEEIGHIYIDDAEVLVVPAATQLPDTPRDNASFVIEGWNMYEGKMKPMEISFRGENLCWFFDVAKVEKIANKISQYTEQEYIDAIVKCIDPKLESIFNRTGEVIQVIPYADFIEVDVDFGRGINVVRLTERQLEIVPV
jgi:hypothetical protein